MRVTVTPEMIAAAEAVDDLYRMGQPQLWARVFRAMYAAMPLSQQAQTAPVVPVVPNELRVFIEEIAKGFSVCDHRTQEEFCAHCGVSLDSGAAHKEDCLTIKAQVMLSAAPSAPSEDAKDAARWRALLNVARIRPLGSAGLEKPETGNYAHLGLELWTVFGRDYSPKLLDTLDRENSLGREWLTKFADIAATAQQKENNNV